MTVFGAFAASTLAAETPPDFEKEIRPLAERYCFDCHNADKAKGDLNLARFENLAQAKESAAIWQRAGMRIGNKEMPPASAKEQPTQAERDLLKKWIATLAPGVDCSQVANDENVAWYVGYVMSRRLNRNEYENTVRDLLGVEIKLAHLFPADGAGGEGFDNNGSTLFLSAIQTEKYLSAADEAIDTVFPWRRYGPEGDNPRLGAGTVSFQWEPNARERELASARRALITVYPSAYLDARRAARRVVEDFATRAWRRPVTDEEIDKLMTMFERGYTRGDGYVGALKLVFKAAMVSPNFIFLSEPEPEKKGPYELGDYQLAARLSYFLWSSMPDGELTMLAQAGTLHETETLRAQTLRMLRDPKAKALGDSFGLQWLGIAQLGETLKPDAQRFPEFDDNLRIAMREEASAFFTNLVREDRSLLEVIDADYTFANERLAKIYGLPEVEGPELRRVKIADARRSGVLGMGAVLTATSQPLRTSPVLRGKWVLEQLLGENVPPPPPTAGKLPDDDHQPDGLSFRARLEAHRKNPDCAGCHARMDPIGFGLENFDPIGRWRDTQGDQPVDCKGELPSGEKFEGPAELKKILLNRKDDIARNLSRKMLGYALGRSITQFDNCVVDKSLEALRANDYRASELFTQIVLSYPFRHRYSGGEAAKKDSQVSSHWRSATFRWLEAAFAP